MIETMALSDLTAADLRRLLDSRQVSSREIVDAHLERINHLDESLGVYLHVMTDVARSQAAEAEPAHCERRRTSTHRHSGCSQRRVVYSRRADDGSLSYPRRVSSTL